MYVCIIYIYIIWLFNIAMENHHAYSFLIGKPSINVPFSMAMLHNQRVYIYIYSTSFGDFPPGKDFPRPMSFIKDFPEVILGSSDFLHVSHLFPGANYDLTKVQRCCMQGISCTGCTGNGFKVDTCADFTRMCEIHRI